MIRISILVALTASLTAAAAQAAEAPAEIKLGTLYASTGRYASLSMPLTTASNSGSIKRMPRAEST